MEPFFEIVIHMSVLPSAVPLVSHLYRVVHVLLIISFHLASYILSFRLARIVYSRVLVTHCAAVLEMD